MHADPPRADPGNESLEEVLELDYESKLPWPSPTLVEKWWGANQQRLVSGVRHLSGRRLTAESAFEVLVKGRQRLRAGAALNLVLAYPDRPLFEVRARAGWQQAQLKSWNS